MKAKTSTSNRKGQHHVRQETAKDKLARKRKEGEERQVLRDARTDSQQLAIIAQRRGESKKEKARLEARATATKKPQEVKKSDTNKKGKGHKKNR